MNFSFETSLKARFKWVDACAFANIPELEDDYRQALIDAYQLVEQLAHYEAYSYRFYGYSVPPLLRDIRPLANCYARKYLDLYLHYSKFRKQGAEI
ncbi:MULTISPECIES: hypothetical protein [unclassified Pseudomonas]|uniref:hypothetical protein n=1 Tax=unclassified Pseudomonas TaxID=196821 RepID=UPI00111C7D2A|nr:MULTISPECIES: hypothetical protein [unclassified Pseudomonas]